MSPSKFVAAACALFCFACPQICNAITYHIPPRVGNSPSWSLNGGTITTDGTIGEISPQHFESWELRFSSPSGESSISSTNGGAFLIIVTFNILGIPQTTPSLTATTDHLIANPAITGSLDLLFATQDIFLEEFTGNLVSFSPRRNSFVNNGNGEIGGGWLVDNMVDRSDPFHPFRIDPTRIGGLSGLANQSSFDLPYGPLVIGSVAAVPEPGSGMMILLGMSILLLNRRR